MSFPWKMKNLENFSRKRFTERWKVRIEYSIIQFLTVVSVPFTSYFALLTVESKSLWHGKCNKLFSFLRTISSECEFFRCFPSMSIKVYKLLHREPTYK